MAGGGCPYQIMATTDKGEFFYLRYRSGWLKAGISEKEEKFKYDIESYNIIREKIGDDLDGIADDESFFKALDGKVIFPNEFKFSSL